MKQIYLTLLLLFSCVIIHSQTTVITDANFEQELVNQGIDTNGINGNILDTDAQSVTTLTLAGTSIADITGINAFVNLTNLDIGNNQVVNVSLTTLSQLISFRSNDNEVLDSVDFSHNALLEDVFIHGNFPYTTLPSITTIDLSQNLNLISFNGDFLNNVTNIIFPVTPTFTEIDIRYLADETLDFSLQSGLEDIYIGGYSAANVTITFPNVFTNLKELAIYSIDIPTIDISNYINLEDLTLWGTYVENLLLPNSTTLTDIFIILHDIQNPLDFSILPNLVDVDITSNQTTPLVVDITQNLLLEDLDLSRNDMNSIDLTQNTVLEQLRLDANNLTTLDVTQNVILNRLSARDNQLPTIDLTQNVILEYLTLSNNLLPNLDITQNIILRSVYIDNNLFTITGLDLTQNADLSYLNAAFNQIESLNILQNPEMSFLIINNNLFTGTDILDQYYTVKSAQTYQLITGNLIVHDNMLSGMIPDFTSIMNIDLSTPNLMTRRFDFEFYNNNFEFGHFENQHSDYINYETIFIPSPYNSYVVDSYLYAPQAKVDVIETINVNAGDAITLTTVCAGVQNHYTWFKDGVAIPGAPDSPNYTIPSVNSCDTAVYHSEITSDLVPFENGNPPGTGNRNLLLIRNDITLNITSPTESCTSLISPINGSTNVAINEVLTWTESLGACGYFISLGTTSGGTDILNNVDIGDVTSYSTATDLPSNTQIFVTITPYFYNGTVLSCLEENFTTGTTTVLADCTSLISPLNGDIDVPVDTDLSWNPVANAIYYRLSIGTIPGTYTILTGGYVGAATTYDITGLLPEGTVIYVLIVPYNSAGDSIGCLEESFTTIQNCNITADTLVNVIECDNYTLPVLTTGNYFTASGGTGTSLNAGDTVSTSQTIYIYADNGSCNDESNFDITINTTPTVDLLSNEFTCDNFTLQPLTVGSYFTASGGTGTSISAGDTITSSQTIYIFETNGNCSDESNFDITINTTPTVDVLNNEIACDSFTLPVLTVGNYFTASGGTGTLLNAGDTITSSQTVYIFETNGSCTNESNFDITINTTPTVDVLNNETACDSYTLPALTVGNYYTVTGGTGIQLNTGDTISTSQSIFIYAENGTCSNESSFVVTINTTPTVDVLNNETACDSFTLQTLTSGNYFTATGGTGTQLNAGDNITTTQTIYIYNEINGCDAESNFTVTIEQQQPIDIYPDEYSCDNYILPNLTIGNYYTGPHATGTMLYNGDIIATNQTVFVYDDSALCPVEYLFEVILYGSPNVDILQNVVACDSYILQPLTNGNYFTQSNGNGSQLNPGDSITSTQIIYIYNESNGCSAESNFMVTINDTPIVDSLNDETACDAFVLQSLTNGNYYSQPNGIGPLLFAGQNITTSQTIYIYNETNTIPNCFAESSFNVIINNSVDFNISLANLDINEGDVVVNMTDTSINYEYSLNGFTYQNSNQFSNLTDGIYTLYVIDTSGCVEKTIDFTIELTQFIIPNYFTPNGDSYNQTWTVTDNKNTINTITIFDRYGKLIKQGKGNNFNWNGTYNGKLMRTNDYWYAIELKNGTVLKGHFTLKR